MSKRKTNEEFISESIEIHGNKYDYSQVNYVRNSIKVDLICPIHGLFSVRPNDHLSKKVGCNKCNNASISKSKNVGKNIIDRFNKKHNDKYDYTNSIYIQTDITIDIICPIHGLFKQTPHHHLFGAGCQKCGNVYKKTTSEFINDANHIHNNRYDYNLTEYKNNRTKVSVICHLHGEFKVTPNDHLNKKSGCPKCQNSKGEEKIAEILDKQKIKYIKEFIFDDCKNIKPLPFDFYLTEQNICIEFDGELHFKSVKNFGGDNLLEKTKKRDKIKTKYCMNNNITLIRIPYYEFNNIEKILLKKIKL
jgi:hypothetical protein